MKPRTLHDDLHQRAIASVDNWSSKLELNSQRITYYQLPRKAISKKVVFRYLAKEVKEPGCIHYRELLPRYHTFVDRDGDS